MALQNILIPFVSLFRSAGLKQAQNALGGLNRQYDSLGKTIGAAVGAMAGFNALQTAQQFVVQSVESTQKFERNLLALNQVFEDAAPQIRAFTKEVEDYGLSQSQAAQASVFLGSVLKQYGFDVEEANASTQDLVVLAQDLATTFGYDVQEALLAITALFRGEYDPIEKFGVAMKQNEINAVRAARGMGDLTGAAEMQADAQIRLELLFERAADSMGAFERASDTLYGSQQRLNAVIGNLQVAFGAPLQEPLAEVNNIFADLIQNNGPAIVEIGEALGESIESLAPAIELLGTAFFNLLPLLTSVIDSLNIVLGLLGDIITASNNAFAALAEITKETYSVDFDTVMANYKVKQLTEEQERLNKAIQDGFDAYGTYQQRLEQIPREKVLASLFEDVENGNRQASAAARDVRDQARKTQQELELMTRINQAWSDSWTARAIHWAEENGVPLSELFKTRLMTGKEDGGTDYVGDFFRSIGDAVKKESARLKLEAMGASEGLINAILGSQGWEQVFKRVIRDGEAGLQRLQLEFNKTAAGIAEVTEEAEALAKAQREALESAQELIDANVDKLKDAAKTAKNALAEAEEAARQFRKYTMENLTTIQILPNIEQELGRFESAFISTISGIQSELRGALGSNLITEDDFDTLSRWVETESKLLETSARNRDKLAKNYSLSKSLISEYQTALTSSLKLTTLFDQLKTKTEEKTITEVSQGVIQLGSALKEFGVTVTRTYEETIEETTDKSAGLLTGFRDMAQKARDFGANLKKLSDLGLDPMLFAELVQAGVDAGGETAQALVDGGKDTILEINSLFEEINKLGADLGMDVGQTMYEAGQDMTFGLLDGIRSEQQQLFDEAKDLARKFSEAFERNLNIAIDIPVKAAEDALDVANEAVESAQMADIANLVKIQGLIDGAKEAFEVVKTESAKIGIAFKQGVFEALKTDILAGKQFDLSGIVRGMSSAALIPAVGALGSSAVGNYFTLTVNAGMGADGTEIGQTIINEILKFERSSGQVFSRA